MFYEIDEGYHQVHETFISTNIRMIEIGQVHETFTSTNIRMIETGNSCSASAKQRVIRIN